MHEIFVQVPLFEVTFSDLKGTYFIAAETIHDAFVQAEKAALLIERSVTGLKETDSTLITPKTVTYNESEGGN